MNVLVLTNMYPTPQEPAFGTFVHDQVEALRRAGVDADLLFINGRSSRINYLVGLFRLWGRLLGKRYHLIHAHHAISGFVARMQFAAPVVATYHGGEVGEFVPWWERMIARRGALLFRRVIVVNRAEQALLGGAKTVRVIPCGVDLDLFRPMEQQGARRELALPAQSPLVLWAGEAWQHEKRFELVEEALAELRKTLPEAQLVQVVGKPHERIPLYMNGCDALLLTSRSEGSPMVIKEAMACNLPIVSTDVGDVAELIAQVENCFVVEPDAGAIAERLLAILRHRQRSRGRQAVMPYSSAQTVRRLIALYNEICPMGDRLDPRGAEQEL